MNPFPPNAIFNPDQPDNVPYSDNARHVLYRLRRSFVFKWEAPDGKERALYVPKGFLNDGASVPRLAWAIIPPDGRHRAAAIIHDFLYEHKGDLPLGSYLRKDDGWVIIDAPWTRKHADLMFLKIMKEYGIPFIRRQMAYRAVRLGGWVAWRT